MISDPRQFSRGIAQFIKKVTASVSQSSLGRSRSEKWPKRLSERHSILTAKTRHESHVGPQMHFSRPEVADIEPKRHPPCRVIHNPGLHEDCQHLIHCIRRRPSALRAHSLFIFMSKNKTKISRRFITGITLDSAVQAYLDDLAVRMRSSRSWVLNTIVYEYAKLIEDRNIVPLSAALAAPASKEAIIK